MFDLMSWFQEKLPMLNIKLQYFPFFKIQYDWQSLAFGRQTDGGPPKISEGGYWWHFADGGPPMAHRWLNAADSHRRSNGSVLSGLWPPQGTTKSYLRSQVWLHTDVLHCTPICSIYIRGAPSNIRANWIIWYLFGSEICVENRYIYFKDKGSGWASVYWDILEVTPIWGSN